MIIPTTYAEVVSAYPDEVATLIARLRKGRSKARNTAPDQLQWAYNWCVRVQGCSFQEILDGTAGENAGAHAALSLEERVADELSRISACIQATAANSPGLWSERVASVPTPIEYFVRSTQKKIDDDTAAYNALPEEERARQAADALAWLTGPENSGFVALSFPPKRS